MLGKWMGCEVDGGTYSRDLFEGMDKEMADAFYGAWTKVLIGGSHPLRILRIACKNGSLASEDTLWNRTR